MRAHERARGVAPPPDAPTAPPAGPTTDRGPPNIAVFVVRFWLLYKRRCPLHTARHQQGKTRLACQIHCPWVPILPVCTTRDKIASTRPRRRALPLRAQLQWTHRLSTSSLLLSPPNPRCNPSILKSWYLYPQRRLLRWLWMDGRAGERATRLTGPVPSNRAWGMSMTYCGMSMTHCIKIKRKTKPVHPGLYVYVLLVRVRVYVCVTAHA